MPPVRVSVLQLNSSYNYSKAVVFGMRISPLLCVRRHKKKTKTVVLPQLPPSTCPDLLQPRHESHRAAEDKALLWNIKISLLSREAFP